MGEKHTYGVRFAVKEHPDTEYEVVSVEEGVVDEATQEEQAVVVASKQSPFTHAETLSIKEIENGS